MSARTTLVLLVLAAALGAFIWLHEIEGGAEREATAEAEKHVFVGLEAERVRALALETSDDLDARLERDGTGGWRLREPVDAPADELAAGGIAGALAGLAADEVYEDGLESLESYGLAGEPQLRFETDDGAHALRIGKTTPVGGGVYVTDAAAERVFVVPVYRTNALRKSLHELREARVLDFDATSVTGVAVRWEGGAAELARADAESAWRMTAPFDVAADEDAADDLLSTLKYLRATGFVDDAEEAAAALAEPLVEIVLARGEDEPVRLAVGAEAGGDHIVRGREGLGYRVPAGRIAEVPRDVLAYRFHTLSRFVQAEAERVEVALAGGTPAALTIARGEGGAWEAAPPLVEGAAGALVAELGDLPATGVLAEALGDVERAAMGLAPPRTRIRVLGAAPVADDAEGEAADPETSAEGAREVLAELLLGAAQPGRGIPAVRVGTDTVFWVDASLAERVPLGAAGAEPLLAAPEDAAEASEAAVPGSDSADED